MDQSQRSLDEEEIVLGMSNTRVTKQDKDDVSKINYKYESLREKYRDALAREKMDSSPQ